jgi:hypothetical protein
MNSSTICYFDNGKDPSHPSPCLESYAREQPSFNLILVEQLPQPFLNAGRSVFAQEFEHQAVERLHANLKRLVAHPQHVELNALHVVHYANLTKPSHATIKPVLRICLEAAAAEAAISLDNLLNFGRPPGTDHRSGGNLGQPRRRLRPLRPLPRSAT